MGSQPVDYLKCGMKVLNLFKQSAPQMVNNIADRFHADWIRMVKSQHHTFVNVLAKTEICAKLRIYIAIWTTSLHSVLWMDGEI
jgi:hypothetical protein